MNYLIASPGRSGSVFLTRTIGRSLNRPTYYSHQLPPEQLPESFIYHTHDATLQLTDNNLTVIQPRRNNLFAEIVSALIAEHYNQWSDYVPDQPPFAADLDMFYDKYIWHKHWHRAFEQFTVYSNRVHMSFEEFIGQSQVVCDCLSIPATDFVTEKSPHSTKNILNIDQLQKKFMEFEQDKLLQSAPITDYIWKDLKA